MTKLEYINKIRTLQLSTDEILDAIAARGENSKATNKEIRLMENNNADIAKLQDELKNLPDEVVTTIKVGEDRSKEFSLFKSIQDVVENRKASESTVAMNNLGKKVMADAHLTTKGQIILPFENRAIVNATTNSQGEYAIAEQKLDMIGALRNELVAVRAGATLLTGLNGSVSIPVYAGTTSAWKAENTTAVDGAGAFSEILLAPKKITTILDISKSFLNQDTTNAENLLMQDLTESILAVLESAIFDATAADSARPAGMLNGVSYTSTGATSYLKIIALESAVNASNALKNKLAYVTTPALYGVGKGTAKNTNAGVFVIEGNSANGYPVYATSAMASGKMIFGNWSDLVIGNWGGIDIVVDPYTQAALGVVRLVVNSYWDFNKRRTASFAYGNLT